MEKVITIEFKQIVDSNLSESTKHEFIEWLWVNDLITDVEYQDAHK